MLTILSCKVRPRISESWTPNFHGLTCFGACVILKTGLSRRKWVFPLCCKCKYIQGWKKSPCYFWQPVLYVVPVNVSPVEVFIPHHHRRNLIHDGVVVSALGKTRCCKDTAETISNFWTGKWIYRKLNFAHCYLHCFPSLVHAQINSFGHSSSQ